MIKILVFGDSIAWGAFDNEKGGWVERLKAYFLQNYQEQGIGVYNFSVSSNDTRGVLKFLESDIDKINQIEKEDLILLFSIGSNDPRYIDKPSNIYISEKEFNDNLQKIIETAKKYYSRAIALNSTPNQLPDKIRLLDELNYSQSQYYLFSKSGKRKNWDND